MLTKNYLYVIMNIIVKVHICHVLFRYQRYERRKKLMSDEQNNPYKRSENTDKLVDAILNDTYEPLTHTATENNDSEQSPEPISDFTYDNEDNNTETQKSYENFQDVPSDFKDHEPVNDEKPAQSSSDNESSHDDQEADPYSSPAEGTWEKVKERFHDIMHELIEQYKEILFDYKEEAKYRRKERRNEFYGGTPPKDRKTRTLFVLWFMIKKFFSVCATSVFSILLILILTCTIVGTTMTVYILSFMDTTPTVVLNDIEESFASYIYQMNKETNEYDMVYKVMPASHDVRIATDINSLPDYVKYAFVCIEDERFYSHEGVDYKRTGAAVANLMLSKLGMGSDTFGGSTITQQLIKNLTQDTEQTMERKMREIFSAMKFEKKYTKDDILQAYLNEIYFYQIDSYHMYGIEAAAIGYYGKSASELTIAEAASLAAIPKSPQYFSPVENFENNKDRKEDVLFKMFELGVITSDQYEEALNQELFLTTMPGFSEKYPDYTRLTENENDFQNPDINSWPVDTAIYEFADYLKETHELESRQEGIDMFNHGGYKLYLSSDTDVQEHLNQTYASWYYFPESTSDTGEMIQSSLAVMDYQGHILGIAGQIGEKTTNLGWNNAYDTHRQPGSTIKPVSTYGYALENDKITWSTYFYDKALPAGVADPADEWPDNYDGKPSGGRYPVNYFLKQSINTLPAQIAYTYELQPIFDFATQKLHLDLDPDYDVHFSPLCVGGTNHGPNVINLANAYMPYGNGGTYYKASIIKKAIDSKTGNVVIDNENRTGEPAVSDETAYVMNKLLQKVIDAGTGTAARLGNTTLVGKTGTTENWRDITFVGLTPDYVSAMWVGYPTGENAGAIRNASSARIWYNVFGTYANDTATGATFPECETVKYVRYCSSTGLIANSGCPGNDYGYYKSSNCEYCTSH